MARENTGHSSSAFHAFKKNARKCASAASLSDLSPAALIGAGTVYKAAKITHIVAGNE